MVNSWPLKLLSEICQPKQWRTISQKEMSNSGYPVYGANGKIGFYCEYNHEHETLLITCRGATCGTLNICEPKSYITGNSMALDDLSPDVDLRFLFFALNYRGFKDVISGTAQPQITREGLKKVQIPIPPLDEQLRLVDILSRAEGIVRLRREAQKKAAELIPSLFLEMFGDPATNPKGWPVVSFSHFGNCRLGKMLDKKKQSGQFKKPYLRNVNVQWGRIDTCDLFEMDFLPQERESFRLRKGDVLICEGGEIGRAAIWDDQIEECYFQKALHRLKPDSKICRPDFVVWLLWFMAKSGMFTGSTTHATIAHITGIQLKNLKVIAPPVGRQVEFESVVMNCHSIQNQQKMTARKAKNIFNALLTNLLTP